MNQMTADAMTERATVTIHTSPETRERLERLAKATKRSKSFLGNAAIERYLASEEAFVNGVLQGIKEANAGLGVTSDEMKKQLHARIDEVSAHKT